MSITTALRSIRIRNQNERLERNITSTVEKLAASPNSPIRVTTNLASFVLIRYPTLLACGVLYSTQVRNVGAGVKELYLKRVN